MSVDTIEAETIPVSAQPKKPQPNWTLAPLLRAQRFTYAQIAEKIGATEGAVKSRANRQDWNAQVARATEIAINDATVTSLKGRASQFVADMADDVDKTLRKVCKSPIPKKMLDILDRESVLEKVNKRGRLTYGLDSDASSKVAAGVTNLQVNVVVGSNSDGVTSEKTAITPEC